MKKLLFTFIFFSLFSSLSFAENPLMKIVSDFMENGSYIRMDNKKKGVDFWNKDYIKVINVDDENLYFVYEDDGADSETVFVPELKYIVSLDEHSNIIIQRRKIN